ncbi:SDR family oxidoreductase [Rhodopseudomonas sp. P2A-2r]|uniref:SDR family oxidoreductase n=1 Tax=unclassified Rhodopseudomonas TaxID=2638247 RepID=UPI00223470DD|nr:SDR family oxidoreductase [Rhodopseudomonas sp. P2A-2r]UZE49273.1 SDR family oxidoreductase [Rhodopseudomonas sp. P2A-2r]
MTRDSKDSVLLTGAAGGLGRAIARAVVASGRRIVLVDRNAEQLAEFAAELGAMAHAVRLDINDHAGVDRILDGLPEDFRQVDVLINNAGHDIGGRTRFDQGSADDWTDIIHTNLVGTMRMSRAVLPKMVTRNHGHVVNISSINAVRIVPDMAAYSASKAGIRMFTETIRGELAETAIRITEILPGLARTGIIVTRYRGDREKEQAYFDQFKMALDPEDVARVIMFALDQPAHVQIAEIMVLPVNRY